MAEKHGNRVVEPVYKMVGATKVVAKLTPLSRVYQSRAAAEDFCALAKKSGHPEAYVQEI